VYVSRVMGAAGPRGEGDAPLQRGPGTPMTRLVPLVMCRTKQMEHAEVAAVRLANGRTNITNAMDLQEMVHPPRMHAEMHAVLMPHAASGNIKLAMAVGWVLLVGAAAAQQDGQEQDGQEAERYQRLAQTPIVVQLTHLVTLAANTWQNGVDGSTIQTSKAGPCAAYVEVVSRLAKPTRHKQHAQQHVSGQEIHVRRRYAM